MNRKVRQRKEKLNFVKGPYSVVKFIEPGTKLFECIPDLWFVNGRKTQCRWPPKSKKSITLCAMDQDPPQDDWEIYDCELVSGGHGIYSLITYVQFISYCMRAFYKYRNVQHRLQNCKGKSFSTLQYQQC